MTGEVVQLKPRREVETAPPWAARAGWGIIAIALFLRIYRYAVGRSLWLDEVMLGSNILKRSFIQLLQPLDYWQGAPIGFLWLERLSVLLVGHNEYALRLVPLLAGLISVFLFYGVTQYCLTWRAGLIALGLFAVLEPLIYYSSEVKQYSMDVAVALAILLTGLRVNDQPDGLRRLLVLGGAGAAAIFFSMPAVFMLAGIGCTLIFFEWRYGRKRSALMLAGIAAGWTVCFLLNYFFLLKPLLANQGLHDYWADSYVPISHHSVPWVLMAVHQFINDYSTMWTERADLGMLMMLLGCAFFWKRDRIKLSILLLPVGFVILASMARQYPFNGRLILFITPLFVVLIAAGVDYLWRSLVPRAWFIAPLLLFMLFWPSVSRAGWYLLHPPGREEMKDLLHQMAPLVRADDLIYLYHSADVAFLHYRDQFGLKEIQTQKGSDGHLSKKDWNVFFQDMRRLQEMQREQGFGRVWLVFSHVWTYHGVDEQRLILTAARQRGQELDNIQAEGAAAYLFDLTAPPDAERASSRRVE